MKTDTELKNTALINLAICGMDKSQSENLLAMFLGAPSMPLIPVVYADIKIMADEFHKKEQEEISMKSAIDELLKTNERSNDIIFDISFRGLAWMDRKAREERRSRNKNFQFKKMRVGGKRF